MINIGFNLGRVNPDYFELCSSHVIVVEETSKKGEAELTCTFQEGKEYIRLLKEHDHILTYCMNRKCADGIIIELDPADQSQARVHIIELKKSMGSRTWEKVKEQFYGASLRALAFASSVGIHRILSIHYYTGYVDDDEMKKSIETTRMQSEITGTIARKVRTAINPEELKEWQLDTVKVFEDHEGFSHLRVLLHDVDGKNTGTLAIV
ncbi:MAG: hypothetical protein WCC10_04340 [Tumebacillaceae bacterium]